jgi:hypothetical protein
VLVRFCFRRRRQIIEKSAIAARKQTPPATPTPMPTFAPVVRDGEDVAVGLLEEVVWVWLVVVSVVEVAVDDDDDNDADDEENEVGSPDMGAGVSVTSGRCAVPVDGAGLDPGNSTTASVGAGVANV